MAYSRIGTLFCLLLCVHLSQQQGACTIGFYLSALTGQCTACPIGEYQNNPGTTSCETCPIGTSTVGAGTSAQSACYPICQPGQYFNFGQAQCALCTYGSYSTIGTQPDGSLTRTCTQCPAGQRFTFPPGGATGTSDCYAQCNPGSMNTRLPTGQVQCTECPRSFYRSATLAVCVECDPGFTTSGTGSTDASSCIQECSAGYYNSGGATCTQCPRGQYQSQTGATGCTSCVAGSTTRRVGAVAASECVPLCRPGTSVNGANCTPCPRGQYQPREEQPTCINCGTDKTTSNTGSTSLDQCVDLCPIGYKLSGITCRQCDIGEYNGRVGQSACIQCPSGRTTRILGATSSVDCVQKCMAGQYINGGSCTECDTGFYQENEDQTACIRCSGSLTTRSTGSSFRTDCIPNCQAGSYISGDGCPACPQGTYSTQPLATSCVSCSQGRTTIDLGSTNPSSCVLACSRGTYRDSNGQCQPCPKGTYQDQENQISCKPCNPGFTTYYDQHAGAFATSRAACEPDSICRTDRVNCHSNALCKDVGDTDFECVCRPGYEGDGVLTCDHICDTTNYCYNDGICIRTGTGARCDCIDGYTGDRCRTKSEDTDLITIIAASVGGGLGAILLFSLIGLGCWFCCSRAGGQESNMRPIVVDEQPGRNNRVIVQEQGGGNIISQGKQEEIIEKIIRPQIIQPPPPPPAPPAPIKKIQILEKEIIHEVPAPEEEVIVEHVYEAAPQPPVMQPPPNYISSAPYMPAPQMITSAPPPMMSFTENYAGDSTVGVPAPPQTIQTAHGVATLVNAGQPTVMSAGVVGGGLVGGPAPSMYGAPAPPIYGAPAPSMYGAPQMMQGPPGDFYNAGPVFYN